LFEKICLVGFQKGVSKTSKGHLLQVNWALIRMQFVLFLKRVCEKTWQKCCSLSLSERM